MIQSGQKATESAIRRIKILASSNMLYSEAPRGSVICTKITTGVSARVTFPLQSHPHKTGSNPLESQQASVLSVLKSLNKKPGRGLGLI